MEWDFFRLVNKDHKCQGNLIHSHPLEVHPMATSWPSAALGVDVIKQIETKASKGHRYILITVYCFTKCMEEATLKVATKKAVVDFFSILTSFATLVP